jgi:hypothetical protein
MGADEEYLIRVTVLAAGCIFIACCYFCVKCYDDIIDSAESPPSSIASSTEAHTTLTESRLLVYTSELD